MKPRVRRALAALSLLSLAAPPVHAAAPAHRALRLARSGAPAPASGAAVDRAPHGSTLSEAVPDGAGGAFVLRAGAFSPSASVSGLGVSIERVYVLRITAAGVPAFGWPADGIAIADAPPNVVSPRMVADGSGGVIVGWSDWSAVADIAIRAQRIDANGVLQWAAAGVVLASGPSFRYLDDFASDGTGGALASWSDTFLDPLDDQEDIVVQRVDALGSVAAGWPAGGRVVCAAPGQQFESRLAADGEGGAVVEWTDLRVLVSSDFYAQRVTAAGAVAWATDGIKLEAETTPDLAPDGARGAIVVWGRQSGLLDRDIYAQRYDSLGVTQWTAGGIAVCSAAGGQNAPRMCADGEGGAFVAWRDPRDHPYVLYEPDALYAQRLTGAGAVATGWPTDGVRLADSTVAAYFEPFHTVARDGSGGALFGWTSDQPVEDVIGPDTLRYFSPRIRVQRLDEVGALAAGWPAGGVTLTSPESRVSYGPVTLSPDGVGGAVAAWTDARRVAPGPGLYARRVDASGVLQWTAGGEPLVTSLGSQSALFASPDGTGGAFVGFARHSLSLENGRIRHLGVSGTPVGGEGSFGPSPGYPLGGSLADGSGGVFVAWYAGSSLAFSLHVQHFDATGAALWPAGGTSMPFGSSYLPAFGGMVSDGAGGVMLAWNDAGTVLAARVNVAGARPWGDGVILNAITPASYAGLPSLARDGEGGLLALWPRINSDPITYEIHTNLVAQALDSLGAPRWDPDGVQFAAGPREENDGVITGDGAGGAFVAWSGDTVFVGEDVWMQHLDGSGVPDAAWPADGLRVCAAAGRQILPRLVSDGAGGAIAGWWDLRSSRPRVYAQRVTSAGAALWAADGVALAAGAGPQYLQDLVADGSGGAIACWLDGSANSWDVLVQRVTDAGSLPWGAAGAPACAAPGDQLDAVLSADGAGGAFVAWRDGRTQPVDEVRAQHVTSAGEPAWGSDGATSALASLESASAEPGRARLVWWTDGSLPRARIERRTEATAWQAIAEVSPDGRGRIAYDDITVQAGTRYGWRLVVPLAQGLLALGETWLEVPRALAFALHGARPNPVTRDLVVAFALASGEPATLEVLDVGGRRIASRRVEGAGAGEHVLALGRLDRVSPGVYWLRLTQGGRALTRSFSRVR